MNITIDLTDEQAAQFAQFLKRVSFSEYRALAENDENAYEMRDAGEKIRESLSEAGFNPR
jgi:hypothetical protein